MSGRRILPPSSEPDSGSNTSGSEDQDAYTGVSGPLTNNPPSSSNTSISRQRYYSRRNSAGMSSTRVDAGTQPDLPYSSHASNARRQSLMVMDRKRRLTGSSNQDVGRRRQGPSAFYNGDDDTTVPAEMMGSSSYPTAYPHRRSSSQIMVASQATDLTGTSTLESNNPLPPTPNAHLSPDATQSMYVVPRWQPDSEVAECPICKRSFTFLFRRHHCRKCGRVVCNDCSPHRITIPRQYIVCPPGYQSHPAVESSDVIEITGEVDEDDNYDEEIEIDEENAYSSSPNIRHRRSRLNNLTIGGGEKVRLCNPCVPDPQPEHQPTYNAHTLPFAAGFARRSEPTFQRLPHPGQFSAPGHRNYIEPFPGVQPTHFMPPFSHQSRSHSSRNHAHTFESFAHSTASLVPTVSSSYQADRTHDRSSSSRDSRHLTHGRYHSFDQTRAGFYPSVRPRIHSSSSSRPVHLNEDDVCPICRRALPPRGVDGDETEREAHVMQCITSRDPTMQASQRRSSASVASASRGPMHMLTFVSNEKDCIGEDGGTLECSICMVEYNVGEQLARLECLCKFHRECIVSWFDRKQECPVHKVA